MAAPQKADQPARTTRFFARFFQGGFFRSILRVCPPVVCLAVFLAACESGPSALGVGGGANYAAGSPLGAALPDADRKALSNVFVEAMARGGEGERYDWRGPESFGWVKAGARVIDGVVEPDARASVFGVKAPAPGEAARPVTGLPAYPAGLVIDRPLETDLGLYAITSRANVRQGPSTDYKVLETLSAGDGVKVLGRVAGARWMLVAKDGRALGYVFETLMVKAPGTELELAGGPTRTPVMCREFEQRISYQRRSDRWRGAACLNKGRWALRETPAPAY